MFNKRVVRMVLSLLAALVITCLLVVNTSGKQVASIPVVVATQDIEANAALTPDNLEVRSIPVTAVPEKALSTIPGGKLAGQKSGKVNIYFYPWSKTIRSHCPNPGTGFFPSP